MYRVDLVPSQTLLGYGQAMSKYRLGSGQALPVLTCSTSTLLWLACMQMIYILLMLKLVIFMDCNCPRIIACLHNELLDKNVVLCVAFCYNYL